MSFRAGGCLGIFGVTPVPADLPMPAQWPVPQAMLKAVRQAYATPHRAYHNWQHVHEVLGHWQCVAEAGLWQQPRQTWLALLYHDAIYQAGKADNEAQSAQFAAAQLAEHMPDADIDIARVRQLIELTAQHGSLSAEALAHDADAALLLDCDMAILASDPARFDAYDAAIAAEYRAVVPGWLFRIKRRSFLKALLQRPRIYLSDFFHQRLDAAARTNLRRAVTGKR